ncbi:MAG: DUF445 family protein [Oscillospiraceae bacterium]|nr:DUF445 family protein [Oscillospiraceae bacterium]
MIINYIAGPVIGAAIGYFTNFIAVKMLFHPKKEIKVLGHKLPFTPGAIPKGKLRLAKSVGNAVGNNLITQADIENKLLSDEFSEKIADMITDKLSLSINDFFNGLADMTDEDVDSRKKAVSRSIAKYISEAISQADISGVIIEKAPEIIKSKLNNPMIGMFLTDELLQAVLAPVGAEIQSYIAEHGEEFITPYVEQKLSDSAEEPLADFIVRFGIDRDQLKKLFAALYKQAVSGCADNLMNWLNLSSIVENKINDMDADELETLVMSVMKKELNTIVNLGALIGFILGLLNIFF